MFHNIDIEHLLPTFSDREKHDIELYYAFSKEYEKEIQEKLLKELENHLVFGPLIKSIPKEVREMNNKESDRLIREAIFENKWEPYIRNLLMQGVQYAHLGVDFNAWYKLISIVRKYYMPILKRLYDDNQAEKVTDIGKGMNVLIDYVMCVIGESFIQEQKRIIELQNTRLEKMVKELESFAYIISHDLKTPLRGISSLADWITEDYHDKLDDTGKEYLSLLKSRVVRLEELIDGVLSYSRAGKIDVEKETIDFNILVKEAIEMTSTSKQIQIQLDNLLPTLQAVKSRIVQVFFNLIENAIKHNDKTNIKINIGCIEKTENWWFYVKDNGPGIEEAFHEKVFQIFQTLKTKDEMNSTGIGLSIVKKNIDSDGGKIWIESKVGKGCTFFFTIKK